VNEAWDDCGVEAQALIIAFDQIATYDEEQWQAKLAGAKTSESSAASSIKPSRSGRKRRT
jgi:hypothetical protein